jgi:hypothetical protein
MFGHTTTLEQMVSKVQRLCFTNQEGVTMSNQIIHSTPFWKQGKYPGMEFCASWSRLEKEDPETFKVLPAVVATEAQDFEYSYKVFATKYGLSIVRGKMDTSMFKAVAIISLKQRSLVLGHLCQKTIP